LSPQKKNKGEKELGLKEKISFFPAAKELMESESQSAVSSSHQPQLTCLFIQTSNNVNLRELLGMGA
jgi:hypothetical protein